MINNIYAKAYTEVLEVLKYFPEEEYKKIPIEKINFYKRNMDKNYKFTINPEKDLATQNISKEANAVIITLYRDYYATEEQKLKINEILDLNQKKEELKKRKQYHPDNIFRNRQQASKNTEILNASTQLVEYKENFFVRLKKFIFKLLHIDKN